MSLWEERSRALNDGIPIEVLVWLSLALELGAGLLGLVSYIGYFMNHSLPSFTLSRSLGLSALMGALGFVAVLLLALGGVWAETGRGLTGMLQELGFALSLDAGAKVPISGELGGLLFVFPLGFLTALVLMETPGMMRRLMLLFSILILAAMWCPVAGLWGRFFNPLPVMVGVLISGVGVMIYMEAARAKYALLRFEEHKARQEAIQSEKVVQIVRKEEREQSAALKKSKTGRRGKSRKA